LFARGVLHAANIATSFNGRAIVPRACCVSDDPDTSATVLRLLSVFPASL
jgi:hypothetical protein